MSKIKEYFDDQIRENARDKGPVLDADYQYDKYLTENSTVRHNLMNQNGYSPYCGNPISRLAQGGCSNPRTVFNGEQFFCPECGWQSEFPADFIQRYKLKWKI
jgi:hypothetical protein